MATNYDTLTGYELVSLVLSNYSCLVTRTNLEIALAKKLEIYLDMAKQNQENLEAVRLLLTPEDEIVNLNIDVK
jgi:hypothetical protein